MDTLSRSSRRSFPFRSLQNEVNQLFESVFPASGENGDSTSAVWAPRMDVKETDDRYRLSLDLPGVSKDDVSITVEDNRLTIRGERQGETRSEDENVVRMERSFGRFYRTLRLPESVNEEQITATFDDGVLSVDLPKTEKSTPTNISIS
jgi:HSP20 family protein